MLWARVDLASSVKLADSSFVFGSLGGSRFCSFRVLRTLDIECQVMFSGDKVWGECLCAFAAEVSFLLAIG